MADTSVTYVGDGFETNFSVPFPYIAKSHVKVYINAVERFTPLHYSWLDSATIKFKSAVADGDGIVFRRVTPGDTPLVNYQNGAVLTEAELNQSMLQNFYLAQETKEHYTDLINNELIRVAGALGVFETDPDSILAAMVVTALDDAAATTLQQRVTDIDANGEAIVALGTNLQSQLNSLATSTAATVYVQPGEPVPGVGGIPDPIADGARWYDSDDNNHPYIYNQGTLTWVDIADGRIAINAADIVALEVTVNDGVTGVAANASGISVLDTTVSGHTGTLSAIATDITTLQANVGTNAADILSEQTVRANADSAMATDISLLGARNGGATAFILNTATVKIDSDVGDTVATRLSGLSAADAANSAAISSEESARIAADSAEAALRVALAATVTSNTNNISANAADIVTEANARASGDSANSSLITALTSRVTTAEGEIDSAQITISAHTSAIAATDSDVATLEAKYGVSLNVNGYVTGFVQNNNGSTGNFVILADKFAIVDPSGDPAEPEFVPFSVSGGVVSMQNVSISGNLLVSGTIVAGHIAADSINSSHIGAGQVGTSEIAAGSITTALINTNAITATLIAAGVINASHIAADAVTATHIADNAITTPMLQANSITAAKILANTITAAEIAASTITAGQIAANTITAGQIAANTITAAEINVSQLSAVAADLGTITAGNITMNTSGFIKGGQTAYNTGTGYWLGYDSSAFKFSIGNGSTNRLTWDGTSLTVRGDLSIGSYTASTSAQLLTANTERNTGTVLSWVEVKKFKVNKPGTVNVYFDRKVSSWSGSIVTNAQWRVKLDGVVQGTTETTMTTLYGTVSRSVTTTETSEYITIEYHAGEYDTGEVLTANAWIRNASVRATIDFGESVITD